MSHKAFSLVASSRASFLPTSCAAPLACCFVLAAAALQCAAQTPEADRLMQRGESRYSRKDYVGAILDFTSALELAPSNAKAYFLRGKAKSDMKLYNYAFSDYTRAIELDPANAEAYRNRGALRINHNVGDCDDSFADLDKSIKAGVDVASSLADRGFGRYYQGDLVAGVEDCNAAIEMDGAGIAFHFTRALCRFGLGDPQGALEDLDQEIADDPTYATYHAYRGFAHLLLGDGDAAQADFKECLRLDAKGQGEIDQYTALSKILLAEPQPETADDFVARANTLRAKKYTSDCISDCSRALAIDPDNIKAYITRGNARYEAHYYTSAAADFAEAIKRDPNDPEPLYRRALAYYYINRDQEGLADCEKALEIEPRHFDSLNLKGLLYFDLEQYAEAAKVFTKYLQMNSSPGAAYQTNLGDAYCKNGEYQRAISALNKAVDLNPDDVDARISRASARRGAGDADGALEDLAKAMELSPDAYPPYEVRVVVLMQRGDYEAALADVDKILELVPYYTQAFVLRSLIHELQGDSAAALEEAGAALMWNSRAADALLTRGLLRHRQGDAKGGQADLDLAIQVKPQMKARIESLLPQVKTSTVAALLYPVAKANDSNAAQATPSISQAAKNTSPPKETNAAPDPAKKSSTTSVPKAAQKYFDNGLAFYEKGEYDQANDEFRRAITLFPRYAEAYMYRGLIHLHKKEQQEADRLFAECLRIQPDLQATVEAERAKIKKTN